jgi:AraC-like DNA-binding protein
LNGGDSSGDVTGPRSKGHLNPGESAPISRYPVEPDLAPYVRHFWVPEWELPAGTSVTARVLGYPTLNLVVDPTAVLVTGPTRRESQRVLSGSGWAVGVLLQPAATPALGYDAAELVDSARPLDEPDLRSSVVEAMAGPGAPEERHLAAVAVVTAWLRARLGTEPSEHGMLANQAVELVEGDPTLTRVSAVAARLHVSERTLQRAVRRCTGFTPAEVVRRRRLQEATDRLRRGEAADLAEVAQEAGYADHAHMTRDFREALEEPPSQFRRHR